MGGKGWERSQALERSGCGKGIEYEQEKMLTPAALWTVAPLQALRHLTHPPAWPHSVGGGGGWGEEEGEEGGGGGAQVRAALRKL